MDIGAAFADFQRGRAEPISIDRLRALVQAPLWYTKFHRMSVERKLGAVSVAITSGKLTQNPLRAVRDEMVAMFTELLKRGEIALGQHGQGLYEFDSERAPILDTFVFHHSGRKKGISLEELDGLELYRLYLPTFINPAPTDAPRLKGKPIYSGHFRNGRQHFYPYHWLIEQDGTVIRLLEDHEIGWHAGDWEINKRSIGICFNADLSNKSPNEKMLTAARTLIHERYSWMHPSLSNVHGHFDFFDTECPGSQFNGGVHWKQRLL